MAYYIYVDNSNVWIVGQRVSAVRKGQATDINDAIDHSINDPSWRMNLGHLHYFAGGDEVALARLYGSRPPANDALWEVARKQGFDVKVFDRRFGKERRVDNQLQADIMEDAYERINKDTDTVVIVAGDQDHIPVIEKLKTKGIRVEVMFWRHASAAMKTIPDAFIELDPHFEHLTLSAMKNAKTTP